MISLTDLKIVSPEELASVDNCFFFTGESIDDRGDELCTLLASNDSNQLIKIDFDIDNYSFSINDSMTGVYKFGSVVEGICEAIPNNEVLFEATTLGFVELLVLLKWFSSSKFDTIKIVYAEPQNYKPRANYMNDFGCHEFDLSTHSAGFKGVPSFTKAISTKEKAILIAIMGFERARLGQLMELDEGAYIEKIQPIFGTPSYQVGWDKHSFFQNVNTLKEKGVKPMFVSANSPLDTLESLTYIGESLQGKQLMVAPFGTKPSSIGAAIFLINNSQDVILKYDHPVAKRNRSEGIGNIHCYTLSK